MYSSGLSFVSVEAGGNMWKVCGRNRSYHSHENDWTWCDILFEYIWWYYCHIQDNNQNGVWWHCFIEQNWIGVWSGSPSVRSHSSVNLCVNVSSVAGNVKYVRWMWGLVFTWELSTIQQGISGLKAHVRGLNCVPTTSLKSKCVPIDQVNVISFLSFGYVAGVMWLTRYKPAKVMLFHGSCVQCIAWLALVVCIWERGWGFLSHGSVHEILSNKHSSHDQSVHSYGLLQWACLCDPLYSFLWPYLLFCILSWRFCSVCVLFRDLAFAIFVVLIIVFLMDCIFSVVKLIFSFQWCLFKWDILAKMYSKMMVLQMNFIILVLVKVRFTAPF
jgi:hypothetical protein